MATTSPFEDVLLGTCVGDALALPAEGLSRRKIEKRWPGPWKMRLLLGRGMVSDDTEHTVMVALSLLSEPDDAGAFQRDLARRLRWWFAALPPGVGMATAKACIKLWCGARPVTSGVFSAGNGPAMRSAILGVFFADDAAKRVAYVCASSRLTHTDPKAEVAALAIAEAAAWIVCTGCDETVTPLLERLDALSLDEAWKVPMKHLRESHAAGESVDAFVSRLGLERGVSGYAYHTVPVALHAWLHHRSDFRAGLEAVIRCGGDTDTVGAIAGALLGLSAGAAAIPQDWLRGVKEWPLSVHRLRLLARALAERTASPFRWWHWAGAPLRNLFLLVVVILHGFRRLV